MKVVLSPNPYRDRGLKAAQAADRILRNAGVETAFCLPFPVDGGGVDLPRHLELGDMVGHMLRTEEELVEAARSLQKKGARNVLVSMAGAGALLLDESGGVHRAVAPKGEVRNSVGSGDAMVAGFLAGWQRTGRYEEALRLAVAAGSATAFSEELVRRGEAEALLSQVSITEMEQA